jgi:hypothetical protein
VRVAIESAEIATLKADGRPWDGPGGPRVPARDLPGFFALDVGKQLDVLVQSGSAPTPPDVFVRLLADGQPLLDTETRKTFDPKWDPATQRRVNLIPVSPLTIQVWDRDVVFDDLIGEITISLPDGPGTDGRWEVKPFGQVRRLILHIE